MEFYFFVDLYGCVRLLTQISLFENTTSINLISPLCVFLFCPFILIIRSGIFERYNVVGVR